ncbi:MAG: hypothetical protein BIFFINMI_00109 [Phycisphaerae bacterium]|nr:hypothetical protein [Phycisphaerae bacterium]
MNRPALLFAMLATVSLLVFCVGCPPVEKVPPDVNPQPAPVPSGPLVVVPRTYMTVPEALTVANLQLGTQYAAPDSALTGVVGPYPVGGSVGLDDLLNDVARATGMTREQVKGVCVFEKPADPASVEAAMTALKSDDPQHRRQAAYDLGELAAPRAIPALMAAVGDNDLSTQFQALMALEGLERDFVTRARYPGRASLITLFGDNSGQDALLYIIDEHKDQGGPVWLAAVSVASRAQLPGVTPLLMKVFAGRRDYVRGDDRPVRAAAWACSEYSDPATVQPLSDLLTADDVDYDLAREAAVALGRINLASSVERLGDAADSKRADVRRAAAEGLGFCQSQPRALEILRQLLRDQDTTTCCLACEALGRLNSTSSLAMLGATLTSDVPLAVRLASASALGRTYQPGARQALLSAKGVLDSRVRVAVAEALGVIGGPGAESALLVLIGDQDMHVRAASAQALGRLGTVNAILAATTVLSNRNEQMEVLMAAADGLGESHQAPDAVKELEKLAASTDAFDRLRDSAVVALGRNGSAEALLSIDRLCPTAAATGTTQRDLAVRFYNPPDGNIAVQRLTHYLRSGNRTQKAYAADRLSELADPVGLDQMVLRVKEWDPYVRSAIVLGLMRSRGPQVVPALVSQLASRQASKRRAVALTLGNHRDPRAVAALLGLSGDQDPTVRWAAAQSLGLIGDPAAVSRLIQMATSETEKQPRDAAIRALRWRYFAWMDNVKTTLSAIAGTEGDCGVRTSAAPAEGVWTLLAVAQDPQDPTMRAAACDARAVSDGGGLQVAAVRGRRVGSPLAGMRYQFVGGRFMPVGPQSGADPAGEWQFDRRNLLDYPLPGTEASAAGDSVVVTDPANNVRLMFTPPTVRNELLQGSVGVQMQAKGQNAWEAVRPAGAAPALRDFTAAWDADLGAVVLVGGAASDETGSFASLEVWAFKYKNAGASGGAFPRVSADRPVLTVLGNGRVQVNWQAVPRARSYEVQRASVDVKSLWTQNPHKVIGKFEKVNDQSLEATGFEDVVNAFKSAQADTDAIAPVFAYKVVALDSGKKAIEESAVALTLADAPSGLRAIERDDGTTLLVWNASPQEGLRGYYVYRQDAFAGDAVFRQQSVPTPLTVFVDGRNWPRTARRKYYIVPVDYLGQLGIPSAGVWSFGAP